MSSDPKKTIETFLKTSGFAFEMRVAKEFQTRQFGVSQAYYYKDSITNTAREIDLIVLHQQPYEKVYFNVVFVVECKYAPTPWVLFSARQGLRNDPNCYCTDYAGKKWIEHLAQQGGFRYFFQVERNLGYGVTVVSNGTKDEPKNNAFEAIQKLLGFLKSESRERVFAREGIYNLFVPIIAIKGKLFDASLDDKNEIEVKEITSGQLIYKESVFGVLPKIHIVTEEGLPVFIDNLVEDCKNLFSSPYLSVDLINNYPGNSPVIR